ncbi:MAG: hypothetical protein GF308_11720 [Candidatus Heimdallarchaeota archaeon]|nr:hypothetical protein [Candidatus Heimdallarchaeota archaeon]
MSLKKYQENKNNPQSEYFYYPMFKRWLKRRMRGTGKNHRIMFCGKFHPHEFDIIGGYEHKRIRKFTLFSIEVKMRDFFATFQQAHLRKIFFDYCYVAFPMTFFSSVLQDFMKNYLLLQEKGIGCLFYDDLRNRVFCGLKAKLKSKSPLYPHKQYHWEIVKLLWNLEEKEEETRDPGQLSLDEFLDSISNKKGDVNHATQ